MKKNEKIEEGKEKSINVEIERKKQKRKNWKKKLREG